MKIFFNTNFYLLIITIVFFSCQKDEAEDKRDEYIGKYSGIKIHYANFSMDIQDTIDVDIFLTKYDEDTISAIELDLPGASQKYLYDVVQDSLVFYGQFYHCPILTMREDSLLVEWQPSLGPVLYVYKAIKVE